MLVGLLTIQEKDQLVGQLYTDYIYFNPIQDGNGDWIISLQEIDNCTNPNFSWVSDLPLIDYVPIPHPPALV